MSRRSSHNPLAETLRSLKFIFTAPLLLAFLFAINWMTSPGYLWVKWAALGIGIAWFFSVLRVLKAILMVGGLAAFAAYLSRRAAS